MQVRWALLGGLLAAPWVLASSAMGWIGAAALAAMALLPAPLLVADPLRCRRLARAGGPAWVPRP